MTSMKKPPAGDAAKGARGSTHNNPTAAGSTKQALGIACGELTNRRIWAPHGKSKAPQELAGGLIKGMDDWEKTDKWMTLPEAQALVEANPLLLTGVGIFINSNFPLDGWRLIALDVDKIAGTYEEVDDKKVLDPANAPAALAAFSLLNQIPTYWEVSPSGMGLHAFAWVPEKWAVKYENTGKAYPGGCDHAEVYIGDKPTFITVTGALLGACTTITQLDETVLGQLGKLTRVAGSPQQATPMPDIPNGGSPIDLAALPWLSTDQRYLIDGTGKIDRSNVLQGLLIRLIDGNHPLERIFASMVAKPALWQVCCDHWKSNPEGYARREIKRAYDKSQTGMKAKLVGFNPAWKPVEPKEIIAFPAPYPGPMADAVAAGLEAAHKPQPELTTMAVLSSMAAACGSFYRQCDGSRLNLYFLGIAKTGTGKDVPLRLAKQIGRLGNAKLIGAPGSGQGLEDALVSNIATYCAVDEIAHFFSAMNDARASNYERANGRKLLELFSASGDEYETRALAGKEARIIQKPAFNLIGFTTPEKLGTAFNPDDFADGLAGRILFVFTSSNPPARRVRKPIELPVSVQRTAMHVENGLVYMHSMGGIVIDTTNDAERMLDALLTEFDQRGRAIDSPWESALCVRSLEKVERIAGVLAVWDNPAKPVVTLGHIEWAAQFVRASNAAVLSFVKEFMHSGDEQKNAAALMVMLMDGKTKPKPDRKGEIAASDAGWVPRSALMRRSDLCKKDFDAAIAYLLARDEIAAGSFGDKDLQVIGLKGDD